MKYIRVGFGLSLFSLFWILSCDTEGPGDYKNHFIKYYGVDGHQEAKDFTINSDGTIVMIGTSFETNGDTRIYVVKSDAQGNAIWSRKLGTVTEYAQDIEPIIAGPDAGNFVVLSNVKKNAVDSMAIRLTVISNEGDSLKSKYFNFLESQEALSVTPKQDGGYFVGGKTTDPHTEDVATEFTNIEDQLLIEFAPDLSFQESNIRRMGGSATGAVVKIFGTGPPFYFAGYCDEKNRFVTDNTYESNFFFRSFNVIGTQTQIDYAGSEDEGVNEYMSAIVKASVFYVAVGTRVLPSGNSNLFATVLNNNFSVITEAVNSSRNMEGVGVSVTADGQYLILGNEITTGGKRNICYTKIGSLSELSNSTLVTFGAPNNDDSGSAIRELPGGDILILGTMELVNQKKMALIKIRANGQF